jgi:hypothetical protein
VFGSPAVPNPRNSIIEMEYSWVFENQVCRAAPLL